MTPDEAVSLLESWANAPDADSEPDPAGYVYLAHMPATGHYKIGHSKTPEGRVQHFDVQMPVEVNLIHSFPADDALACEKHLHQMFEPWRAHGEWFALPSGQALMIQYYRGYADGQLVINPEEVWDLVRDMGELPPGEVQPHPKIKAQMREWRQERDRQLRERTDWPELERDLPIPKPDLKDMFEHVRSAMNPGGCDNTLRHTLTFIEARDLPQEQVVSWLEDGGGYCDCEVLANVAEIWEWRL